MNPGTRERKLNWIFLCQRDDLLPLSTFSNQTPASPDRTQAIMTETRPINLAPTVKLVAFAPPGSWTKATPAVMMTNDVHLRFDSDRFSSRTENRAVVRIFSWYVTWNVAASRLETATYCRLFWIMYSAAGTEIFIQSDCGPKVSLIIYEQSQRLGNRKRVRSRYWIYPGYVILWQRRRRRWRV